MRRDSTIPESAHFIGIGGAGMSGIALVLHGMGTKVTGSDLKESRYISAMSQAGIRVSIGHDASTLGDAEVVVVSSAISDHNPELVEARKREVPIWPRAKMLACLAGDRLTVAVAGTHGKTSTSAMIATMLDGVGVDPTFVVGGEVSDFRVNAKLGSGIHYVVESDESDGSFLHLDPAVGLVTNIEAEHLDHYGSLEAVEATFAQFMRRVSADGALVLCADDRRLLELACDMPADRVTYGFSEDAAVRCHSLKRDGMGYRFIVAFPDGKSVETRITVPGQHMVQNATGALAVAAQLGLDLDASARALATYGGVKRRFDRIGSANEVTVFDDYAHHPTEIKATLKAAKECGYDRVCAVFQPHRYSRTEALANDFGQAFTDADHLVLMDVFSAGEQPIPGISGKTVLDAVLLAFPRARVAYLPHRADVPEYLSHILRSGDMLITLGAGDVTTIGPNVLRVLDDGREIQCR